MNGRNVFCVDEQRNTDVRRERKRRQGGKKVIPSEPPLLARGSLLLWVPLGIRLRFDAHTEFYGDVLV